MLKFKCRRHRMQLSERDGGRWLNVVRRGESWENGDDFLGTYTFDLSNLECPGAWAVKTGTSDHGTSFMERRLLEDCTEYWAILTATSLGEMEFFTSSKHPEDCDCVGCFYMNSSDTNAVWTKGRD